MERRLLKFSESKVRKLTLDYDDQTLGGMRKFEEVILPDGIKRTYTYAVEFTKFIKRTVPIKDHAEREKKRSPITKMYKECKINAIVETTEATDKEEKVLAVDKYTGRARGRPRKYPMGEEPYKKRRTKQADPTCIGKESAVERPLCSKEGADAAGCGTEPNSHIEPTSMEPNNGAPRMPIVENSHTPLNSQNSSHDGLLESTLEYVPRADAFKNENTLLFNKSIPTTAVTDADSLSDKKGTDVGENCGNAPINSLIRAVDEAKLK